MAVPATVPRVLQGWGLDVITPQLIFLFFFIPSFSPPLPTTNPDFSFLDSNKYHHKSLQKCFQQPPKTTIITIWRFLKLLFIILTI